MAGLLFETLDRSNIGKRISEEDFDMAIMPFVKRLAGKYEIKYNPSHPISDDDAMADRLFTAALEFAVETGIYVIDTGKVIKFTEAEIWRCLMNLHTPLMFGSGRDQVLLKHRKPESDVAPLVIGGPAGSSISEGEIYVKHMMAFAMEPTIDMLSNGNPTLIEGREIRSASPLEVHGAIQEVGWIREAIRRVGRPGLPLFVAPGCSSDASAAIAVVNEERGLRRGDLLYAAMLTEMKTDYDRLSRAVVAIENGLHVITLLAPMIGGWAGGVEGAVIVGTAACLLAAVAYNATIVVYHPVHMNLKNGATTHRETLWIESITGQALARNTIFPLGQNVFLDARSGTYETFYEAAANAIVAVSSGQHTGPGPSGVVGGDDVDMITGLEVRMMGEVSKSATGMSRKLANEIVLQCLEKYEPTLGSPPRGKRFQDLYDIKRLKPTDEWQAMFEAVKIQLKEWGVPFRY
jgi:methylamine--corrinoid protein Co-methyltransferase